MSANLRREMTEIAAHAQNLCVETSVRVASMIGEFARSMGASSCIHNTGQYAAGKHCHSLRAHTEAKEGK